MAVTASSLQQTLESKLTVGSIAGAKVKDLARGIAQGFVSYLPVLPVQTTDVGTIGAGTSVSGKVQLAPPTGTGIITGTLRTAGLKGPQVPSLAKGVAEAIADTLLREATVNTAVVGVAAGTGVGGFVAVPARPLSQLLQGTLRANGINGPKVGDVASGLGKGIAGFLQTATITTTDAGSPVPFGQPSSGSGTGNVT